MVPPLTHLDTLTWTRVLLALNRNLVRVWVSLAPLIFAGFTNRKEFKGCLGLPTLVWVW